MNLAANTTLPPSAGPVMALDLAIAPYLPVQDLQRSTRRKLAAGRGRGVLLLLEHPPVITVGANANLTDILDYAEVVRRGVHVTASERGGRCTLHAPGQLIAYPVIPIPRRDLRAYVHDLEEVLILLLASYGLTATRIPSQPGVYAGKEKIASIGLRCERGIASHGTALNVDVDLSLFELLTSCGDPHLRQTSMSSVTGRVFDLSEVKSRYVTAFRRVFGLEVSPLRAFRCPSSGTTANHELE